MRLANKVAVITGASSGIGAACARRFVQEGARVALLDRTLDGANSVAAELGDNTFVHELDVTDAQAVTRALDAVTEAFGQPHILVNSAGITMRHVPADASWAEGWQMVMDVNVKGTLFVAKAFCERLVDAEQPGSIINLSSIYGQVARPPELSALPDAYVHSKGAVLQLTRDLASGHAARNIRVNCLCPGFIETPLTEGLRADPQIKDRLVSLHPMQRLGTAEEVANCALFLASDEASFVTGAALAVDGGYLAV